MTIQFPSDVQTNANLAAGRRRLMIRIHRRRTGTRVAVGGGALLLAGSGVAASVAVSQVDAEMARTSVVCYAHDDLGSLNGTVATAQALAADGTALPVGPVNKAEMCAGVWRGGLKEAAANGGHWPDIDPNTSTLPVPTLAFCTLANGMTGGFPVESPAVDARDVCNRLGLPYIRDPG